jgi:hypothetical protein
MRVRAFQLAATITLLACDKPSDPPETTAPTPDISAAEGFITTQPAQARVLLGRAKLTPILTVGDPLPGQESNPDPEQRVWAPIPDGLGAVSQESGRLVLFANHEITSGGVDGKFPYSRVSRLVLDPSTLKVTGGSYAITGKDAGFLLQRLCSATFAGANEGFGAGWFFTGEESTTGGAEGVQTAVKRDGSMTIKLPGMGRFSHENYIAIPGFQHKVVLLGTDDTSPASLGAPLRSELYLYVANSAADVLAGNGKLYVFTTAWGVANSGFLKVDQHIKGRFVEIPGAASLSADDLQAEVDRLGAFKFVRLEDADYLDDPSAIGPSAYFVDTGNINAQCDGRPCDLFGSIYRIDLDRDNPAQGARLTLVARSRGVAAGDWASPDNISVSRHSLMVQEDPAYSEFNRPERIWNFPIRQHRELQKPVAVVELENEKFTGNVCSDAAGSCWESSGIIDASEWLGEGTWLFDVQAHTLPFSYLDGQTRVDVPSEGGQLLYLRLPGS